MKEITHYGRASINSVTDLKLFTAGVTGLMFTSVNAPGLTLKAELARGGIVLLPNNPVGAGLGYGDSLLVSGNGDIFATFYGTLEETYRINGGALEVLVATPITFNKAGNIGSIPVVSGKAVVIKPGIYTDRVYSLVSATDRRVTWP